jgi:hypothetical protein
MPSYRLAATKTLQNESVPPQASRTGGSGGGSTWGIQHVKLSPHANPLQVASDPWLGCALACPAPDEAVDEGALAHVREANDARPHRPRLQPPGLPLGVYFHAHLGGCLHQLHLTNAVVQYTSYKRSTYKGKILLSDILGFLVGDGLYVL